MSLSSTSGSYQMYGAPGSRRRTRLNQERSTSAMWRTSPWRERLDEGTGRDLRAWSSTPSALKSSVVRWNSSQPSSISRSDRPSIGGSVRRGSTMSRTISLNLPTRRRHRRTTETLPAGTDRAGLSSPNGRDRPVLPPVAGSARRSPPARRGPGVQRRIRSRPRRPAGPRGQRSHPELHRRRGASGGCGPPALPAGRRGGGGVPRRLRARRLRLGVAPAGDHPPTSPGRAVHHAPAHGRRRVPGRPDRFRVHLRRAHPPRDPERPLGPERARDHVARALHAPARLHRHLPAGLRGPRHLSPRPLPRERHDDGDAHRRPELGSLRRAHPVPRGAGDAGHHGRSHQRRRQQGPRRERHRPQRRGRGGDTRRDVERGGARSARRVQGVHGVEPRRPGVLAARTPSSACPSSSTRTTSG